MNRGYLRKADKNDIKLLYDWANDPATRKASFDQDEITWETHEKWFHAVMESEDVIQFIYVHEDVPIGQIRINLKEKSVGRISYSIAKEYRNQGYARKMLSLLEEKVKNEYPGIVKLTAEVKAENVYSLRVFEKLDYSLSRIYYEKRIREK